MAKIPPGVGPQHSQVVVLVGATGDLSRRKLLPGLFYLSSAGFIPGCRIIGVSLDQIDADGFRKIAREALDQFSSRKVKDADWAAFAETLDEALRTSGIRLHAVTHDGCAQSSKPEAEIVKAIFASLLKQDFVDKEGAQHRMSFDNILVVAPYNAQVNLLRATLPAGARVGTIDKFQGQQAEAVIVSMTSSNGECLPRNIEFLYDKNRLNVAVSRAKCLAIVVASPDLLNIRCNSPAQMELVNTLCWLREYADGLDANRR